MAFDERHIIVGKERCLGNPTQEEFDQILDLLKDKHLSDRESSISITLSLPI